MDAQAFLLELLGALAIVLTLLIACAWVWGMFLDRYEHDPGRVRACLFLVLAAFSVHELKLCMQGIASPAAGLVCLVANLWGGLDAVLRFPQSHDVDSPFALKQLGLLAAKMIAYSLGFRGIGNHLPLFLFVLAFHVWAPPALYFMALPMDPSEQVLPDDSCDVDLLVRVWQLARCPSELQLCLAGCGRLWQKGLAVAHRNTPLGRLALCAGTTKVVSGGALRHRGRSV